MLDKRQLFSTESLLRIVIKENIRRKWERKKGEKWGDTERWLTFNVKTFEMDKNNEVKTKLNIMNDEKKQLRFFARF